MSFYRKYRPQTLTELVGQDHVRQTFSNALQKHQLTHAYLFAGPRGTGKTSTARIIARAINCEKSQADGEPCNQCSVCLDALASRLVDLIEIDAASNRGIDEMRDLKEKIQFQPSRARAKIYIIDEVHMLTKEAFNALLKTLEEPPAHAYFILATTEAHKVPETIISRCQRFDFHRISIPDLVGHLKNIAKQENIEADEKALELIARQSAGGHRDALGLLEQIGANGKITVESVAEVLGLTRPQTTEDFVFALLFAKLPEALATIEGLVADGVNLIQFNKSVVMKLRELMLERVAESKLPEAKNLLTMIEVFTRTGEELKNAVIPQLPLEVAVIEICGAQVIGDRVQVIAKQPTTNNQQLTTRSEAPKAELTDLKAKRLTDIFSVDVQKVFPKILGQITKAATKLALKECVILRVEEKKVVIGVPNNFILEKLNLPAVKNELAELLATEFKTNLVVAFEIAEIELATVAPEISTSPPSPTTRKSSLAEAAEELFSD